MSPLDLDRDRLLIEEAKTDPAAFSALFDLYYDVILRYVVRRTADVAVAEDLTADVFMKALQALPNFKWQGVPVSAWLYRIALNELRMYYRRGKSNVASLDLLMDEGFEIADARNLVEELQEAQDKVQRH